MIGKSTLNEGLPYSKSAPGFALTRFFSSESLEKTVEGRLDEIYENTAHLDLCWFLSIRKSQHQDGPQNQIPVKNITDMIDTFHITPQKSKSISL